jgi:hypothetical protein
MVVEEAVSILLSLVPYLNTGTLTLIVDLGFDRLGFKITKRELRKEPLKSLFWALCLVFISSIIAIIIQTRLSGFEPFIVFIALFTIYLVMTQL